MTDELAIVDGTGTSRHEPDLTYDGTSATMRPLMKAVIHVTVRTTSAEYPLATLSLT